MAHAVIAQRDQHFKPDPHDSGLEVAMLVDASTPSVHMELALCRLAPNTSTRPLVHAFEESWYILEGSGIASIAELSYQVRRDSFGVATVGTPERKVAGSDGMLWLRMRSPMPPPLDPRRGDVLALDWAPSGTAKVPDETDPRLRYAGQFTEDDMGPRGPLSMPGYHGPNIKSIFIRMLVDDLLGSTQHTQFIVEFGPRDPDRQFASPHYHPFEEAYYLLTGSTHGVLDGEEYDVEAGDLVWTGVGGVHGFYTTSDVPVRWIEVQSPSPPSQNAFFFPNDWAKL